MTPGQNSTLNCDPNPRSHINVESWVGVTIKRGIQTWGHNSMWNQDLGVTIQRGIMTEGQISTWNLDRDHNSTWNSDPGSHLDVELWPEVTIFNVELWPRVKIPRWIITPGRNSTLKFDRSLRSQSNVESWLEVKIQRKIKTRGHNSTWNQDLGSQLNEGVKFYPSEGS